MLEKDTQDRAVVHALSRRVVTVPPASREPDRRYRFRFAKAESIFVRASPEDLAVIHADPQAREVVVVGEYGADWRAGWRFTATAPARAESRFFPWGSVLEVRGETAIVLESRDPEDYELESEEAMRELDPHSEDWGPVDPSEVNLEALATAVLEAMEAAAGFYAGHKPTRVKLAPAVAAMEGSAESAGEAAAGVAEAVEGGAE